MTPLGLNRLRACGSPLDDDLAPECIVCQRSEVEDALGRIAGSEDVRAVARNDPERGWPFICEPAALLVVVTARAFRKVSIELMSNGFPMRIYVTTSSTSPHADHKRLVF